MALCIGVIPVFAGERRMSIKLVEPDLTARLTIGPLWEIYLHGVIDNGAGERLEREIKANNVQFALVYLDSSGGSVSAGMKLGRLFRKLRFSTYILKATPAGSREEPGECYSACVYAFIGGYFRYMNPASTIGVHRFSKTKVSPADLDIAQVVSATITSYLTEMGVDVALFELMSRAGKDEIRIISSTLAKHYRIVNNGFHPSSWSIEALEYGLYLRGIQEAWYGIGKSVLFCAEGGQIVFQALYYEAWGHAASIVTGAVRHSFRVNDDFLPLEKPIHPLLESNGYAVVSFVLPTEYVSLISKADAIGYAAHPPNPDLYWGFKVEIGDARGKIDRFIKVCKAGSKSP
jgi:hypothetical protein